MRKSFFILLFVFAINHSKAQDISQIIAGSLADANKYATEYMRPFAEGEINNLS